MEVLYKYAENVNGKIIHINNAMSGEKYICPECKEKFTFKNGKIRQRHFSHSNSSSNCTGEGYLHKTFKKMLLELIRNNLSSNLPLIVNFKCNICNMEHNGDILNEIIEVKDEHNLEMCRPDIVLINKKNAVPIIIEIVDKHEPEVNVFNFCKKNSTVLIRIKIETINDLENVNKKISFPSNVFFFNQLNCPNYQQYIIKEQRIPKIILNNNRIIQKGPTIEQLEAKKRRQYYAIKNSYKNKPKRKK